MAVITGLGVFGVGWAVFGSEDWWPNALAEIFGLLVGGVALAVVLAWLLKKHEDSMQEQRSNQLVPVLRGRLHPILEQLHVSLAQLVGVEVAATWDSPLQRFTDFRTRVASMSFVADAASLDRIHSHYEEVSRSVKRAVDECLGLGMAFDPSAEFAARLARLEEAGYYRLRPIYLYGGRGGFDPQEFSAVLLEIIDAATPLAEFVSGSLADDEGRSSRRVSSSRWR